MIYTFEFSFVMSKDHFFLIHTGEGKLGVKISSTFTKLNKDLLKDQRLNMLPPSRNKRE